MSETISQEKFLTLMRLCCTKETSASPDTWTPKNPLWGHCAAVSLVAQNMFGGTLLRVSLTDTPFKAMRSHYFNKLPDGTVIDFTKEQFGKLYPSGLKTKTRTCGSILEHESTRNRYKKLALRFAYEMTQNVLLLHPLYGACFEAALDSGCQKLWVGSVLVHNGVVVSSGNNHPVEELAHVCKPKCIRFNIQSRTESMIGACGHAEEYAMWEAIQKGIPLSECDMYVAMVGTDGLPRFRSDPSVGYTCLRCATAMRLAGIKNVYIDIVDHWEKISIKDALQSALQYALGEKKL